MTSSVSELIESTRKSLERDLRVTSHPNNSGNKLGQEKSPKSIAGKMETNKKESKIASNLLVEVKSKESKLGASLSTEVKNEETKLEPPLLLDVKNKETEITSPLLSDKDKDLASTSSKSNGFIPPENWANAPEFVPKCFASNSTSSPKSYAQVASVSTPERPEDLCTSGSESSTSTGPTPYDSPKNYILPSESCPNWGANTAIELCPYAMMGECRFGEKCAYIHGLKCEFCGALCLHPFDPEQRANHSKECVAQHEKDMELSFAVARSSGKTCGICMEIILEKNPPGEQRFGILPSCIHCFCLSCIRRWRQARQFENKIIRACPECRVTSDYVCPSRYWVDTKEEKEKLIRSYLESLSKKPCRYYRSGLGECPFGNKCFYLHALPDGRVEDVGPPKRRTRRQNPTGQNPSEQVFVPGPGPPVSIWEFLEQWELQWYEIEDLMDMMDSDDTSMWSGDDEEDFYDAFDDVLEWDRSN